MKTKVGEVTGMKWTAYFRCVETSEGWGSCGDIQSIGNIEAPSPPEALKIAMGIRPGNWIIDKLEQQKENN
jgi:hypothetical protein